MADASPPGPLLSRIMISCVQNQATARLAVLQYSISHSPIFQGLPDSDLQRLVGYAVVRFLPRGSYVFRKCDPVEGFYLLRRGLVNVHQINAEGREQIIHLLRPGGSFAERAITSSNGYPAHARAMEDSEVILIPIEPFRLHQQERPELAWRMLASMSEHLRALVQTLERYSFQDLETRLIHWLLQRCPTKPSSLPVEINHGLSQTALAADLATRRETLSRALRKLRDSRHIETKSRAIVVRDPSALRQHFQEKLSFKNLP